MSAFTEEHIEKCVDELKQIRAQEDAVLNRLRTKGVTTDEQIANISARIEEQRIARLNEPWPELFKREMCEVVEKLWVSRVRNNDYSDYGGFLYRTLKELGWFDRKIDSAQLLVLFRVDLNNRGMWKDGVDKEDEVLACISPFFSVEEDGKPSVDWTQFQPCGGGITHTTNSGFQ